MPAPGRVLNSRGLRRTVSDREPASGKGMNLSVTMPAPGRVLVSRGVHRSVSDREPASEKDTMPVPGRVLVSRGVHRSVSDREPASDKDKSMSTSSPSCHGLRKMARNGTGVRRNHSNASTCSTVSTTRSSMSSPNSESSPTISQGKHHKHKGSGSTTTNKLRSCLKRTNESKKANGIRWNHKVEKKRHVRRQDLTPEERESIWYTENDSKLILAMAKVTVKMMMRGEHCDDIDYCSRGLEGKTLSGAKRRQKNKLQVRKALLDEQEFQRDEDAMDSDYLALVSMKNSKEMRMQAHHAGLQDEQDVREYLMSGIGIIGVGTSSFMSHRDVLPVLPTRRKKV